MLFVKIVGRERRLLARRQVAPRPLRLRRRAELRGHEPDRGARVARAPSRRERGRAEEQDERDEQRDRPLGDEPPVVAREEADAPSRAACGAS